MLLALRIGLPNRGALIASEPNLSALLDLVALCAVADVVKLDRNNRIFGSRKDWPALVPARRAVASPPCSRWLAAVEGLDLEGKPVLGLFNPEWHQGVIGFLASRLKDRLYRPAIVSGESLELKGSDRSK